MRTFASLAILLFAFVSARADQLIVNGGFESGTLAGWTAASSNNDGGFTVTSAPYTPDSYNATVGAADGTYYAVSDDYNGYETQTLTQSFTTPSSFSSAVLSFDMFVNDVYGAAYGSGGPGGEVSLLTSTGTLITILNGPIDTYESSIGTPNNYVSYDEDIASLLSADTTYELQFSSTDTEGPLNVGIDDVSLVTSSPVPEPATFPLLAAGGALVFWMARRKTNAFEV